MNENIAEELYPFEINYSFTEHLNGLYVIDTPKKDNSFLIKFIAHGPGFDLVASALEEATFINHVTGKPFIRSSVLYSSIFKTAIVHVEFPDNDKLESFDVNKIDINSKHYNLIKIICKHWLQDVL